MRFFSENTLRLSNLWRKLAGHGASPSRRGRRRVPSLVRPSLLRLEALEDRITPNVTLITSYAGLNNSDNSDTSIRPPDTNGAAGTVSYIETANQVVRLFPNKNNSGGAITSPLKTFFTDTTSGGSLPTTWKSGNVTQSHPTFSDPIIVWDEQISRFVVGDQLIDENSNGASVGPVSAFYLAVSKSATPVSLTNNDWTFYAIDVTEDTDGGYLTDYFADYPGNFGWNHDSFVFTLNMYPLSGNGITHVEIGSVSIQDLQSGVSQANLHYYKNDLNGVSDRPTVMHDSVTNDPMWLVSQHVDDSHIDLIKMTNVLSNSAIFTTTSVPVNSYSEAVAPLQPNGTPITTDIDSRIQKAAEYNGMLVASQTVSTAAKDRDMARWYEFNVSGATPTLVQQGNVTDTTSGAGQAGVYDTYPAIDIDAAGAIGMTYTQSASPSVAIGGQVGGQFMSAYITGRVVGDTIGEMEVPPLLVQAGQTNNNDGREGDLSGINVDSDGTFWSAAEVANGTGSWTTAVAHFNPTPTVLNFVFAGSVQLTINEDSSGLTRVYFNGILQYAATYTHVSVQIGTYGSDVVSLTGAATNTNKYSVTSRLDPLSSFTPPVPYTAYTVYVTGMPWFAAGTSGLYAAHFDYVDSAGNLVDDYQGSYHVIDTGVRYAAFGTGVYTGYLLDLNASNYLGFSTMPSAGINAGRDDDIEAFAVGTSSNGQYSGYTVVQYVGGQLEAYTSFTLPGINLDSNVKSFDFGTGAYAGYLIDLTTSDGLGFSTSPSAGINAGRLANVAWFGVGKSTNGAYSGHLEVLYNSVNAEKLVDYNTAAVQTPLATNVTEAAFGTGAYSGELLALNTSNQLAFSTTPTTINFTTGSASNIQTFQVGITGPTFGNIYVLYTSTPGSVHLLQSNNGNGWVNVDTTCDEFLISANGNLVDMTRVTPQGQPSYDVVRWQLYTQSFVDQFGSATDSDPIDPSQPLTLGTVVNSDGHTVQTVRVTKKSGATVDLLV
jgi:hypothetical protein